MGYPRRCRRNARAHQTTRRQAWTRKKTQEPQSSIPIHRPSIIRSTKRPMTSLTAAGRGSGGGQWSLIHSVMPRFFRCGRGWAGRSTFRRAGCCGQPAGRFGPCGRSWLRRRGLRASRTVRASRGQRVLQRHLQGPPQRRPCPLSRPNPKPAQPAVVPDERERQSHARPLLALKRPRRLRQALLLPVKAVNQTTAQSRLTPRVGKTMQPWLTKRGPDASTKASNPHRSPESTPKVGRSHQTQGAEPPNHLESALCCSNGSGPRN